MSFISPITDSAWLYFLQAGAGAVTRSVQSKLRDVVSVKDFGAIGDGVANDATYFASALSAATGKELVIPPGTYKLDSGLTVPDNTVITGYGATLDFSGAGNITALTLGSNVRLEGFKIIGPGNAAYNANSIGIKAFGTDNSPSAPTYVTGPTLVNLTVVSFANYGINLKYINNGIITGCRITDCGYAGIGGLSCNRLNITDNYIGQISPGTSGNAYGVFVDRSGGTLTADPRSNYVRIINNMIEDVTLWEGIDTHGGNQFVISDNIVNNCKKGIVVTDSNVGATPTYGPKYCVVANNQIYTTAGAGSAIILNGAYAGGTTVDYAEGCVIENNVIYAGGVNGGGAYEGSIRVRSSRGCKVRGNSVTAPYAAGVSVYFDNIGIDVSGNTISDPRDSTDAAVACISVDGNNNTGRISENTFVYTGTVSATYVAVNAVKVIAGRTGLTLNFGASSFIGKDASHLLTSIGTTSGVTSALEFSIYEEGTWTPTQGAGLTVVGAFSSSGTYTRVGRQVTIVGNVDGATSIACAAGGVLTSGLPYAPASVSTGVATDSNLNSGSQLYVSSTVYSDAAITAAGSIKFSATYFV